MSNEKMTDAEIAEFMKEMSISEPNSDETSISVRSQTVITPENIDEVLYQEIGAVLDVCKEVGETLADRIKAGDNFEGTMVGFSQATDNLMKSLKFLDARETLKIKHKLELDKMRQAHEYRSKEIDQRNTTKGIGSSKNVTNVFIGSRDEFMKQANAQMVDVVNSVDEAILIEENIDKV
jgi:hypothetical protein